MVADKGKKSKITEVEDSDHIDGDLIFSVQKLQEAQEELDKINEEACDKVLEVEQKYNEIRRPVYVKRNEIIREIPDFWLTAFLSHPALCDLLTEEDQKIFKYLDSLDVEDFKDVKAGYCITFNFRENPYFEETKLTKTFTFFDEGTNNITGTNIKWKEGMGTVNGVNHEKNGNKRPLADKSFFSWFDETEWNVISEPQDDVADIIKEDLWPNPLKYFNEEAEEDSDQDEDEKENDASDEEEDDEEEEDGKEEEN